MDERGDLSSVRRAHLALGLLRNDRVRGRVCRQRGQRREKTLYSVAAASRRIMRRHFLRDPARYRRPRQTERVNSDLSRHKITPRRSGRRKSGTQRPVTRIRKTKTRRKNSVQRSCIRRSCGSACVFGFASPVEAAIGTGANARSPLRCLAVCV